MTETLESRTAPRYDDDRYGRPNRLNQVLAWVGIVAGVVFVVAVVFFSGSSSAGRPDTTTAVITATGSMGR